MKDITKQFHDILESKRNKTFKSEIHSKKKKNKEKPDLSPLLSICIDIFDALKSLQNLLYEHQFHYLHGQGHSYRKDTTSQIEKIDKQASDTLQWSQSIIKKVQDDVQSIKMKDQYKEHWNAIIIYLYELIENISMKYNMNRMNRLEISVDRKYGYTQNLKKYQPPKVIMKSDESNSNVKKNESDNTFLFDDNDIYEEDENNPYTQNIDPSIDKLDKQIKKQLKKENLILQINLDNLKDKVNEVESQVMAIAQAQKIISQNLMIQKDSLIGIHSEVNNAHDYIERGTDELKRASENGNNRRLYVIVFINVMALLLLLLHWYED